MTISLRTSVVEGVSHAKSSPYFSHPQARLTIIHNPVAGGPRRRFRTVMDALKDRGCVVAYRETRGRGDAEAIASRLRSDDCDRLVVAGGDGTINEAVNGLAAVADAPPLAVIPLGTANVLAAEIGLALSPRAIADAILDGPVRTVSLGQVNGRRFLLMAGVGFDASVVAAVDARLKRRIGKAAYVAASLRKLAEGRFGTYRIVADGKTYEAHSAVAALSRHYGGPWVIAREAGLAQPTFQLCLFERGGRHDVARYALALMRGRLDAARGFRIVTASSLVIEGRNGEPVQADGDIVARLPAAISILPATLRLVFPAAA